jgi:hypothetical protein
VERYIGVKKFIESFKPTIDWEKRARKKAKEKGVSVEEIKAEWEKKRINGINAHKTIQQEMEGLEGVNSWNIDFTDSDGFYTNLPEKDDKLENGIYLERPCFSHKQGLIGFPDKIEVKKNEISIEDYKTFGTLYRVASGIRVGGKLIKNSYHEPIANLDDCNYIDTCLQLSMYMYILWENNRHLKVGKLYLTHVKLDEEGNILDRVREEVPYLRTEVRLLLDYKRRTK